MKRIYLLLLLSVAFSTQMSAQNVDLAITVSTHTFRPGGNNLLINGGPGAYPGKDSFFFTIKNMGPTANDSIRTSDTIKIKTAYGGLTCPPTLLKKDSSASFYFATNFLIPTGTTHSTQTTVSWCDSVYAVKTGGTAITDPVAANNKVCNTIILSIWNTGVSTLENNSVMSLYPNPATNTLKLKYEFAGTDANVTIHDIIGRVVYQQQLGKKLSGEKEFSIDISTLTAGVYMVELATDEKKSIGKITVQK